MNYIEIDNKLINLDNVTLINTYKNEEVIKYELIISFNSDDVVCVDYANEEECLAEYNRIKSILIGDNDNA